MPSERCTPNELILGLVSISDRASRGEYQDEGLPALRTWCEDAIISPVQYHERLIADDRYTIEETLRELVDHVGCDLVLTTGGTGPALRDVTQGDRPIWDVYATKRNALRLAVNAAITILKVDQIIMAKEAGGPKLRAPQKDVE